MSLSKARLCSALLALGAWAAPALAADPMVTIVAAPSPAQQGQAVDISVLVSNISDLYGYNLSLSFDASLLQAVSATEGSFLGSGGTTSFDGGSFDNTAGTISYTFGSLIGPIPGVTGSGTLATFRFNTVGAGAAALGFVASDTLFLDSASQTINVQAVNTTLNVSAVPEPAHYLMLLAGLAGIAAWRRRQSAA